MKGIQVWRFWVVALVFAALPLFLIWRATNLLAYAVGEDNEGVITLKEAGEDRTIRTEPLVAYRGIITDRNGELLAVSTRVSSIILDPYFVDMTQVPEIAKAVNMPLAELKQKLVLYRNKHWMPLAQYLPPQEAKKILDKKFAGVSEETAYKRFYPAGEVAAHVVGITNFNDAGTEGIELAYDSWLRGEEGMKKVIKDRKGNVVKELDQVKAPIAGKNLQLTIDLKLQYLAYRELKRSVLEQGAKSGSMVMLDAKTGEVLAVVNQPSYNPNDRSTLSPQQMRNRAVTDVFEPASTVKPFTMTAALESGKFHVGDRVDTSPGAVFVNRKRIHDPVSYGVLDLTGVIRKSSQVGITKIALQLDPDSVRDVFFRAGLGQSSALGFPGEQSGHFPNYSRWRPIERANFAFGYGLSVNAMQLAQAYLVLANNGMYKQLTLVKDTQKRDSHRVFDEKIVREVVAMMKTVPEPGGTATAAQIPEYPVAGKTGTAHKVIRGGGYAENKYRAVFAGFAPADDPRIVAIVVVNEPKSEHKYSGGKAAAPIFANVVEKSLKMLNVVPVNTDEYLKSPPREIARMQ